MGHRTSHSCFSPFARSPNAICFLFNVMVLSERPYAECMARLQWAAITVQPTELWTNDLKCIHVKFQSV